MRDRFTCSVELRRFEAWRSAVLVVSSVAVASMAAWGGLALSNRTSTSTPIASVAAVLALMSALVAKSLWQLESGTLSCDDGVWTFAFERDGIERIETGELAVAIDVGSFLLLVLTRMHGSNRLARRWLPVQRRGLEAQWHVLRCAVYSPPPAVPIEPRRAEPLTE